MRCQPDCTAGKLAKGGGDDAAADAKALYEESKTLSFTSPHKAVNDAAKRAFA